MKRILVYYNGHIIRNREIFIVDVECLPISMDANAIQMK